MNARQSGEAAAPTQQKGTWAQPTLRTLLNLVGSIGFGTIALLLIEWGEIRATLRSLHETDAELDTKLRELNDDVRELRRNVFQLEGENRTLHGLPDSDGRGSYSRPANPLDKNGYEEQTKVTKQRRGTYTPPNHTDEPIDSREP